MEEPFFFFSIGSAFNMYTFLSSGWNIGVGTGVRTYV